MKSLPALRCLFALICLGLLPPALRADSPFEALLDRYYEDYLALFPIDTAINGDNDPRYEAVWPNDISAGHRAQVAAMCDKYLTALAAYDRGTLPPADRLSYDTLQWSLTARRELGTHFFT